MAIVFLHWFWVGFFLFFGLLMMSRKRYLSVSDAIRHSSLRRAAACDPAIQAAIVRREEAEGQPPPLGLWSGLISVALAVVAAFDVVPSSLLYGILCFCLAALTASAFLRLRNSQRLRTAVLAPRSSSSVIPAYWFAVAVLTGVSVLSFVTIPHMSAAAVLVSCSTLATTYIAWRLTHLPALLSGVDIEAEQRVDDKLRFLRSATVMVFALVQAFVFATQIIHPNNTLQVVAYWLNFPTWIGFAIWMCIPDPPKKTVRAG